LKGIFSMKLHRLLGIGQQWGSIDQMGRTVSIMVGKRLRCVELIADNWLASVARF